MIVTRRQTLAMSAALLSSIARGSRAQAAKVKLTVSHGFQGHHAQMLQEISERFSAINPDLTLEIYQGGDNWEPQLQATLRAGVVGDLPDLSHQSLTYVRQFVERGYARPINDLVGKNSELIAAGLIAPLLEAGQVNGTLHAVPFGTTIPVVYYNRSLLRRAGLAGDRLPTSWQEIIALGRNILALDGAVSGGYIEYTASNAWMFQNILASFGGRMVLPDESDVGFDTPEGLKTLEVLRDFGSVCTVDMTQNQARQAFNSGTLAILIRSASGIQSVAGQVGKKFDLAIGNLPVPDGYEANSRLIGASHGVLVFTRDASRLEAARKYLRFVVSPEAQSILAKRTGYMPVNSVAVSDPAYLGDFYRDNPNQRTLVDRLPTVADWYSFPKNPVMIVTAMTEIVRSVVTQKMTPDTALNAMITQTRQLMKA